MQTYAKGVAGKIDGAENGLCGGSGEHAKHTEQQGKHVVVGKMLSHADQNTRQSRVVKEGGQGQVGAGGVKVSRPPCLVEYKELLRQGKDPHAALH
jgi:hypothetical protein